MTRDGSLMACIGDGWLQSITCVPEALSPSPDDSLLKNYDPSVRNVGLLSRGRQAWVPPRATGE